MFTNVVNYDTDNGWTNIFDKIKNFSNAVKEPTKATQNFVEEVKDLYNKGILEVNNLDALANKFIGVDKSVVSTAKSIQKGNAEIGALDESMKNASGSATAFGVALKNIAANVAIMLLLNVAIKAVTTAWDKFNVTVKEAKQRLSDTQSTISDLKSQIQELESIDADSLTQGQKDKLENLKEQLSVQEQLEQVEKRRVAREAVGNGNFADYFDADSYPRRYNDIVTEYGDSSYQSVRWKNEYDNIKEKISSIDELISETKSMNGNHLYDDYLNSLYDDKDDWSQKLEKRSDKLQTILGEMTEQKASILSMQAEIQGYMDDGSLVGGDYEKAKAELAELDELYTNVNNDIKSINQTLYNADDQDWIDELLNKTQYSLPNLQGEFSDDELKILATLDIDKNTTMEQLHEIIDNLQLDADGNPVQISTELSGSRQSASSIKEAMNIGTGNYNSETGEYSSTLGDDLTNYKSKIEEIQTAISGLSSGSTTMLDLATNFGIVGDSVADCKRQLDELAQEKISEMESEIDSVINSNDINPVTVTMLEKVRDGLDDVYNSSKKFSSISLTGNALDDIQSLCDSVGQLDKIYADVFDGGDFDWSSIFNNEEFQETFGDLGEAYDNFIATISKNPDNVSACQKAFDDLSGAFLYHSHVLDELDESESQTAINMLTEAGYANADAIVMSALAAQKEYAANAGISLADSTYEDILQIMEEGNVTDETKTYLENYIIAKANASGYTIQTSGDISNLEDLINALHNAGIELGKFNNLRSGVKTQTNTGTSITTPGGADDNVGNGNKSKNSYIPPVHYTGGSATNSARDKAAKDASKGAKDAEDEAKKAAEEAEKALTDALSHIKNAIDELDKESSDKFSNWSSRNQALADEMGMIPQEIAKQQELYDFYMSQGDTTKAEEAANAIKDLQRNLKELANQKLENIKQFYSDIIDLIDSLKELKNAYIDLKEAKGLVANEVDYRELMAQSEQERQNYEKELTELQNQLQDNINNGYIEEGSEAWYEWQKELNGIKKSIIECKKEQVEWNNAIKKLPFDALEKYTILIQKATDRINGANDILEAKGLSQSVANINEQLMALNETMSVTVHNRKLIFDALHDGLSDSEYGWADLNEDQIQKVFDYINTDDSLGLHDYLTSLGVDMYQFAKDSENSVWSYVQELSTVNQKIQETEKSQIELNKSIRDMGVKSAEAYGKLIDKANADIDNKNTLWEARGMDKTIAHYTEALQGLEMSIGSGSNKRYQDVAKIYQNFADGVNGWSQLDTSQIDKVMEFVNSNDSQGLFTYLGSLGIDASQLDEFWELVEDIQSIDSDITSARQKQIEFNKALQQMDISTYEKLNELLSKAKTEIEGLKSLIESHGKNASDNLLSKQIETSMKTADLSKSMIETYRDYISSQLSDNVSGWASLTKEQIQKVFSYLDTNDTDGLNKYFNSLGMSAGTLTEFWEIVSKISSEESNIFSEMTNQEKYFDEMLQNRISQLDDIKEKLNKINDAKNKALELEKARFALIQAMNNRNVMTWDGNQMVWTQDSSAVSSATENLNNLEFQALIDSIEDATDSINELIKNMNLYDDNGNLLSNWKEILASAGTSVDDIVSNIIKTLNARGYNFTDPKFNSGNSVIDSKYKDLISVEDVVDRDLLNSLKLAQQQNLIDFKSYLPDYTDTLAKSIRNISSNNTQTTNVTYQLNGDFIMPNIHDDAKLDDFIKDLNSLSSKAEQRVNRI